MREQAHQIQDEVRRLLEDVGRLRDRVGKLDTHFRQSQEDVIQITTSADKVLKRGERIEAMDFEAPAIALTAGQPAPLGDLVAPPESDTLPSPLNRTRDLLG
jgi:DNA recombination protein RmuC